MAQQQFTTYKQNITSFELRSAMLGIIRPGRYGGYNVMSANGTPSGGYIPITISHSTSSPYLLDVGDSALSGPYGVVITTQGTIIREDQTIDLTIPDNDGSASIRYYAIYIEHDYVEVQGDNPATYGFISGTPGDLPEDITITESYHRVVIGWIKAYPNAVSTSLLVYFPAQSLDNVGEDNLLQKLFGSTYSGFFLNTTTAQQNVGTIPSGGIVGNREYSSQYYITNFQSITSSLNSLDISVKNNELSITALQSKKLDDMDTPDDNTDLNATPSYHGLLPKLPSTDATIKYLRGDGSWTSPEARVMQRRLVTAGTADVVLADLTSTTVGAWTNITLSGIVASETGYVELMVWWSLHSTNTSSGNYYAIEFQSADNTSSIIALELEGGTVGAHGQIAQINCFLDSSSRFRFRLNTSYGTPFTSWNQVYSLNIGVSAYDKAPY